MISKFVNTIRFVLLIFCFICITFSQQNSNAYKWKLMPGMPEWKKLTTHEQKLKALEIPEETLIMMTTKNLVQTCLEYPLFSDMWAFNSLQEGMEVVITGFNGFQELLSRKDAGNELLTVYKKMNPSNFDKTWSNLEKGCYMARFAKIEVLMSQKSILSNFNQSERILLLKESVNKHNSMKKYSMYDMNSQEPNAFLIGKVLQRDYQENIKQITRQKQNIQFFLEHGSMANEETINEIVRLANDILNKK